METMNNSWAKFGMNEYNWMEMLIMIIWLDFIFRRDVQRGESPLLQTSATEKVNK